MILLDKNIFTFAYIYISFTFQNNKYHSIQILNNYSIMNILIIGFGFVGKATYLVNNRDIQIYVYDINPDLCIPKNLVLNNILQHIDLVFISLPTPLNIDGTCYTKLIDDVLSGERPTLAGMALVLSRFLRELRTSYFQ